MQKDFDIWNELKKKIHFGKNNTFFHEREIWFCSLGVNVGFEQDGKNENFARPVLISRKFNNEIFLAVPLSSKLKKGKYYHTIQYHKRYFSVILSQIRLLDGKRLMRKIRSIHQGEFDKIVNKVKGLL